MDKGPEGWTMPFTHQHIDGLTLPILVFGIGAILSTINVLATKPINFLQDQESGQTVPLEENGFKRWTNEQLRNDLIGVAQIVGLAGMLWGDASALWSIPLGLVAMAGSSESRRGKFEKSL